MRSQSLRTPGAQTLTPSTHFAGDPGGAPDQGRKSRDRSSGGKLAVSFLPPPLLSRLASCSAQVYMHTYYVLDLGKASLPACGSVPGPGGVPVPLDPPAPSTYVESKVWSKHSKAVPQPLPAPTLTH